MPGNWYVPGRPRPTQAPSYENGPANYAENRFTRAPMYIGKTDELGEAGEGVTGQYPISPSYIPNLTAGKDQQSRRFLERDLPQSKGAIYVNPDPDPALNSRLMRHEGVHSLLDQNGVDVASINASPAVIRFAEPLKRAAANNMGDPDGELPSYMAAFREGDLPGVTAQQRAGYLQAFGAELSKVHPKAGAMFQRMILQQQPQMSYGRR